VKKCAVFTIVKNEKFFVKLWYNYYSKYFDKSDIFILNHQTTDDSLEFLECNKIEVINNVVFDHFWLRSQVEQFQKKLLQEYEIVVFSEVDEFIVPLKYNLKEYLNNMTSDYVTCIGYKLCNSNMKYDETKLVLEQKNKFVLDEKWSNKTLISKKPLQWKNGFHNLELEQNNIDVNLILLHLHYFDYDVFMQRVQSRMIFKDKFSSDNEGTQNKYDTLEKYINDFNSQQNEKAQIIFEMPIVF